MKLGIFSLEKRQLREDMAEVCKIPHGIFTSSSKTRNRTYQMKQLRARLENRWKKMVLYVTGMLSMVTKHIITSLGCGNLKTGGFWVLGDSVIHSCPVLTLPSAHMYGHRWRQVVQPTMAILISETYIYCHKTETRKHNESGFLYKNRFSSIKHPDWESGPFFQ